LSRNTEEVRREINELERLKKSAAPADREKLAMQMEKLAMQMAVVQVQPKDEIRDSDLDMSDIAEDAEEVGPRVTQVQPASTKHWDPPSRNVKTRSNAHKKRAAVRSPPIRKSAPFVQTGINIAPPAQMSDEWIAVDIAIDQDASSEAASLPEDLIISSQVVVGQLHVMNRDLALDEVRKLILSFVNLAPRRFRFVSATGGLVPKDLERSTRALLGKAEQQRVVIKKVAPSAKSQAQTQEAQMRNDADIACAKQKFEQNKFLSKSEFAKFSNRSLPKLCYTPPPPSPMSKEDRKSRVVKAAQQRETDIRAAAQQFAAKRQAQEAKAAKAAQFRCEQNLKRPLVEQLAYVTAKLIHPPQEDRADAAVQMVLNQFTLQGCARLTAEAFKRTAAHHDLEMAARTANKTVLKILPQSADARASAGASAGGEVHPTLGVHSCTRCLHQFSILPIGPKGGMESFKPHEADNEAVIKLSYKPLCYRCMFEVEQLKFVPAHLISALESEDKAYIEKYIFKVVPA
jgi:hypothetical protein